MSNLSSTDRPAWAIFGAGLLLLYVPTLWSFFHGVWQSDEQAHGPLILMITSWLIYRAWPQFISAQNRESHGGELAETDRFAKWIGWTLLTFGLLSYIVGRSQTIEFIELGSLIFVLAGSVLVLQGTAALKVIWFPLFFMIFMVPLPGLLVAAVTMPMKIAVSFVAEFVLYNLGYPIARTGVILQVGQYQLLVADACAGLHTLFTLEALGLLYLNLMRHESLFRNVTLAILIVPISFFANVIRVIVLTLVTYHFGDAAGQGFLHGFAGMVLFLSALLLIIGVDALIRIVLPRGLESSNP
jgi:exosortase B